VPFASEVAGFGGDAVAHCFVDFLLRFRVDYVAGGR
jgi:hypothetical protein